MSEDNRFSVIIPVCHGGTFLRNALASARRLDYPADAFEVIVAVSGHDAQSADVIESEPVGPMRLICVRVDSENRSAKLNAACAVARGRIWAFADDDGILLPDWLMRIESVLAKQENVGAVGGPDELADGAGVFDRALDAVFQSFVGTGGCRTGAGPSVGTYYPKLWNMAIPREVIEAVSTAAVFDESLEVHEDVDLINRILQTGRRILYAPEVRVKHCRDTTLRSVLRRNFNMGMACRKIRVHCVPHWMMALSIVAVPVLAFLGALFPVAWTILAAGVGAYLLVAVAIGAGAACSVRDARLAVLVPVLLMGIYVARALGYLLPESLCGADRRDAAGSVPGEGR